MQHSLSKEFRERRQACANAGSTEAVRCLPLLREAQVGRLVWGEVMLKQHGLGPRQGMGHTAISSESRAAVRVCKAVGLPICRMKAWGMRRHSLQVSATPGTPLPGGWQDLKWDTSRTAAAGRQEGKEFEIEKR